MTFRVGQKVVCINDTLNPETARYMPLRPKRGTIYTIESIHVAPHIDGYGVRLVELPNPSHVWSDDDECEWSFDSRRFRPLVSGDDKLEERAKELHS